MLGNGGGHGNSKSGKNLRSPFPHAGSDDSKQYKKKYEEARESLRQQKRLNEQLEGRVRELEGQAEHYEARVGKQDRELQKKEEINEVLLDRIRCLKGALAEQAKKSADDTGYEDKNYSKSGKNSLSNDDAPPAAKGQPMVGGYFGSIFK